MTKTNITKFEAKLSVEQGLHVSSKIRTHSLEIDEPKELGGTDKGPNPVELLLAALGGCQAIVLRFYGEKRCNSEVCGNHCRRQFGSRWFLRRTWR